MEMFHRNINVADLIYHYKKFSMFLSGILYDLIRISNMQVF